MAIQTATTGNLDKVQNVIIGQIRFTAEHNDPCRNLIENFTLGKGNRMLTIPKVGAMSADALVDGVDMVASKDIGMTSVDLTCSEVGLKIILTKKLLRQAQEDMFKIVGRQGGDAMSRKVDRDIIALFAALNGASVLGADNKDLYFSNAAGCVAWARTAKAPKPIACVHHPNAIAFLSKNAIGAAPNTSYGGIVGDYAKDRLNDFWKINVAGVSFFEDGNSDKLTGYDSGDGAIFSKSSMAYIESQAMEVDREFDASLRAWEIVITSDYGVFEIDDNYGAAMQYEIGTLTTTATQ